VPFAAGIIGFKPSSLPPVSEGEKGIRIGHIQSGHWADRAGLRAGDIITHVNGAAVMSMESGPEFIDSLSQRPLRMMVEIGISPGEVTSVFQSFDWTSRFKDVNQIRTAAKEGPSEANAMFERVFDPKVSENRSPLFDASSWVLSKKCQDSQPPATEPLNQVVKTVDILQSVDSIPDAAEKEGAVKIQFQKAKEPRIIPKEKWSALYPMCLWYKIEQGYAIPTRAGTLGLDFLLQPFSSEPMIELSLILAPAEPTLDNLLIAPPIEPSARIVTPICDASYIWNASGSLFVGNKDLVHGKDIMILGKLKDYRRLEEAKTMGVFAIRLNSVVISDDLGKATPSLISLTSADPSSFDLSKTKIKLVLCLKGSLSETIMLADASNHSSANQSKAATPTLRSAMSSSVGSPEIQELGEEDAPTTTFPDFPQTVTILPPFQRAYEKAVAQVRRGDRSPIKMQNINIR